jgi:hypothetical protein
MKNSKKQVHIRKKFELNLLNTHELLGINQLNVNQNGLPPFLKAARLYLYQILKISSSGSASNIQGCSKHHR